MLIGLENLDDPVLKSKKFEYLGLSFIVTSFKVIVMKHLTAIVQDSAQLSFHVMLKLPFFANFLAGYLGELFYSCFP